MRRLLITGVVGLAVALTVFAQTAAPPFDFSGTWVLNFAKSKLAVLNLVRRQTIVISCSRSAVVFRTTAAYFADLHEYQTTETYMPDGQEHVDNPASRMKFFTKAEWKNSALFTEWGFHDSAAPGADRWNNNKERWTLSADGNTLTRDSGEIYVYDKH